MRKFLFCAKATYQMNHAAVRVFRRVSVLQQKNSGTLIGQVALQCMGTININQGTSSADLSGKTRIPFGTSFLFNWDNSFVRSVREAQGHENRFPVLIPASVGEQWRTNKSSDMEAPHFSIENNCSKWYVLYSG